ncbi:Cysteine-rich receptor-like protein [Vigna angularis]|uniref:Cysteine-rich receptor-like protein n=1 Tax=Phaseolus angularis TaxID=3914 RepID=A0A8T0LBL1_PHAAN|nr:Cysteine-rich receptor-like protein [Vigna angularis]
MIPSSVSFLLLFLSVFAPSALSDPRAQRAALLCTNRTVSSLSLRQVFVTNFVAAMDALTPLTTARQHGAVVKGSGNVTVYAMGECMKDLSQSDCNVCLAQCKTQLLSCLPFQKGTRGGRLFFDGCYLRYDDYNFFAESIGDQDTTVCGNSGSINGNSNNSVGASSSHIYKANALELVTNLSEVAPKNDGFLVGSVERKNVSVYGLAQCWEFVNGSVCKKCLADAATRISSCATQEGRALNAGCYLRYSAQKFYNNSTDVTISGNHGRRSLSKILVASAAAVALLLVVATVVFFIRKKIVTRRRERRQFGGFLDRVNKSRLNMPYEILEKATDYFNDANKLGQGGSGSVYKVWSLYGSNRLSEVVVPTLEGPFPAEEACRLLQIGLLCAQASAELRPSMSVVVKMVNQNHEIPQPTQPPFIHSGSSELSRSGLPGYNFQPGSNTQSSANTVTESLVEPR